MSGETTARSAAREASPAGIRAAPADGGTACAVGPRSEWGIPILQEWPTGDRPLSRVVACEDWDDPSWLRFLDPPLDRASSNRRNYDSGLWERTHLLYGLDRIGKLTPSARVLVIATLPDAAIAALSEHVGRVDVLDLAQASARHGAEARLYWSNGALYARDHLFVHEPGTSLAELGGLAYDVVVCPHGSLFLRGSAGIARLLAASEQVTASDGVVVFKAEVAAGVESHLDFLDAGLAGDGGLVAQLEAATAFVVEGGFDAHLSQRTASSLSPEEQPASGPGYLLWRDRGRIVIPSLWFLRKRGSTPAGGWERVEQWLVARLLGDQTRRMQLGPAGRWDEAGRIVSAPGLKGRVFFGPYIALPTGDYEAVVGIAAVLKPTRRNLAIDVVAGDRKLEYDRAWLDHEGSSIVRIRFRVPPVQEGEDRDRIEIRASSSGLAAAFTQIQLSRVGA
jgi:hypothetical protein